MNKLECKGMNKYAEMAHQVDPEISGEYKSFKRKKVIYRKSEKIWVHRISVQLLYVLPPSTSLTARSNRMSAD